MAAAREEELKDQLDKNELLIWACARGLLADATELISTGADPHAVDKSGRRAVHYAAAHGHLNILEHLSTKGVDLDVDDAQGRSALHYAALGRHDACAVFLISKGAWVDAADGQDSTALHLAARGLGPAGIEADELGSAQGAPEGTANHAGSGAVIRALAGAGAKLNLRDARGLTPAGEAVVSGNAEALAALIDADALLTITYKGYTLLHLAAGLGHTACLERLLVAGRRPDTNTADNEDGYSALHAAAAAGQGPCISMLLDRGADASMRTPAGASAVELLPPQGAALQPARERLQKISKGRGAGGAGGTKPPAHTPATADAAASRQVIRSSVSEPQQPVQETPLERFQRLSDSDKRRKVESWARMSVSELQQLDFPPSAAFADLQALRKAQGLMHCWEAVAALRQDEAFQEDVRDPHVAEAFEYIQKPAADPERYRNDRQVQSVMAKLNKLYAVLRQEGQGLKVTLEQLKTTPRGPASVEETVRQLDVLRERVDRAYDTVMTSILGQQPSPASSSSSSQVGASKKQQKSAPSPTTIEGMDGIRHRGPSKSQLQQQDSTDGGTEDSLLGRLASQPLEPVPEAPAEGKEGIWPALLNWRYTMWDGSRVVLGHVMRALFSVCLMLLVMWMMGMMPEQIRERGQRLRAMQQAASEAAQSSGAERSGAFVDALDEPGSCRSSL